MKVYTKSGSCYSFFIFDGSLRAIVQGREIIITDIKDLEVGKRMTISGHALNIYCQPQETKTTATTSVIVKIED